MRAVLRGVANAVPENLAKCCRPLFLINVWANLSEEDRNVRTFGSGNLAKTFAEFSQIHFKLNASLNCLVLKELA